jgi:hypothetical protein
MNCVTTGRGEENETLNGKIEKLADFVIQIMKQED